MKVALITDTHWGARGDSLAFADYIRKFYQNTFFPYLKDNNIKRIIHLGDIVDRRKYINYVTARRLKEDLFIPCHENGIELDVIIGNHDTSFKNTNEVNAMNELYSHSSINFRYHSDPTELDVDGLKIAMLPWVCSGNFTESMEFLKNTDAQILFGHLEIQGFEMYRGAFNDHGFESNIFDKFDIQRIFAQVYDFNGESMNVLEKAGYIPEAILKRGFIKRSTVGDIFQYVRVRGED